MMNTEVGNRALMMREAGVWKGNWALTVTDSIAARHPRECGDPVHGLLIRVKPNSYRYKLL